VPKVYDCPFWRWEERMRVHCEGGNVRFSDAAMRADYIGRYCANNPGWKACSIAAGLLRHYEGGHTDGGE